MDNGMKKRFFKRPIWIIEPGGKRGMMNAELSSPLSNGESFAIKCNIAIVSLVIALLSICRPATIIRRITGAIIDAFNAVIYGWSLSHIFNKVFNGILPSVTDGNSSGSVIDEIATVEIRASINNSMPYFIFGSSGNPMSSHRFRVDASAGSCIANEKRVRPDYGIISTRAMAIESCGVFGMQINDSESVKCFAGKINKCRHNILRWILLRLKGVCQPVRNPVFSLHGLDTGSLYHV